MRRLNPNHTKVWYIDVCTTPFPKLTPICLQQCLPIRKPLCYNGVMVVQTKDPLVQQMLNSPRLPHYVQELTSFLAKEKEQRQAFYSKITASDKAEYINGEIIFHPPVKLRHDATSKRLMALLQQFVQTYQLGYVGAQTLMVSLTRNDYKPDICFFGKNKAQQFKQDQTHFPAPDFIVEVLSKITEVNDRGTKFEDYATHSVGEYWIIDPVAETVEQYLLQSQQYELIIKAKTGDVQSVAIDGFIIPVRAIFNEAVNRDALQQITANV